MRSRLQVWAPCLTAVLLLHSLTMIGQLPNKVGARVTQVYAEHQPTPDLGNGSYRNPIVAGNYADNAVVRVGSDYYMVHCCATARGILVWHSRDLVNWEPYSTISVPIIGSMWAPDLNYVDGLFYLYLPMMSPGTGTVWAMTAKSMNGPWSTPVNLGVQGIDPGLVVDGQGNKYLYVDAGRVVALTASGLATDGELKKVYSGWSFPKEWNVQCFCLESPKLIHHGDYYYLLSAEGGTDGPSTSHMAAVARSKDPIGPWENSPYNPLVHTFSRSEHWWSQGHGILIDDVQGNWWLVYHAIENGYQSLGRQTLLAPISWTSDGWPRIKDDEPSSAMFRMPVGEDVGSGMPLSDEFNGTHLGLQWNYANISASGAGVQSGGGELRLKAGGRSLPDAPMIWIYPVNHAYEAQVEVQDQGRLQAGLVFAEGEQDSDDPGITGGILTIGELSMYVKGKLQLKVPWSADRVFFKIEDINHDISVYYGTDGKNWTRFDFGLAFDGLTNVRVGLLGQGIGDATFRQFEYRGLDSLGPYIN